jgi:hypothetical protein
VPEVIMVWDRFMWLTWIVDLTVLVLPSVSVNVVNGATADEWHAAQPVPARVVPQVMVRAPWQNVALQAPKLLFCGVESPL